MDCPAKQRKLPERGRGGVCDRNWAHFILRWTFSTSLDILLFLKLLYICFLFLAKVQIEPNSIQRKTRSDISPLDETRSTPASSCERILEETEPRPTSSEIASSSLASTELSPSDILDIKEDTLSSAVLDKNSKTSTASSEQSRAISPPPVRRETPPPQDFSSSSQGVVENINFPETDPVEPSASGVEVGSQPVHQTTPLASNGPLTR